METSLRQKLAEVWPLLDERSRRLLAATEARALGYGGISLVRRACGLSRKAIAALPDVDALRAPVIVNHSYLVLEVHGDTQSALDHIGTAVGHETELGASGRALYHYVLARCYLENGQLADVRNHLDDALEQPTPPRLRRKIEALDERVRTGRMITAGGEE